MDITELMCMLSICDGWTVEIHTQRRRKYKILLKKLLKERWLIVFSFPQPSEQNNKPEGTTPMRIKLSLVEKS